LARALAVLVLALAALALPSHAHESRPLYVEVQEEAPARFRVRWRTPGSVPEFNLPDVQLAPGCTPGGPMLGARDVRQRTFVCPDGLTGTSVLIRYAVFNPSVTSLIRFARLSGEAHTAVLGPDESAWRLPPPETPGGVAREYLGLGVEHILGGADHLLFLACLIFVARTGRRILITATGFTLAHSVTLALAALGWVRVPVAPVEAAIALSIVFVATEIARNRRDTVTWRYPIAVASSFGLLHGFGFAAVLQQVGLPQTELPMALLFFNLGVEVGQVLFIAALIVAWAIARRLLAALEHWSPQRALEQLRVPVAYGVGWISSYWLIARLAAF
jgi:hypothetical protein